MGKWICFLTLLLVSPHSIALTHGTIYVGGGGLAFNMNRTSANAKAKASMLGTPFLPLSVKYSYSWTGSWYWFPSVSTTYGTHLLFPQKTPDRGTEKNLFFLGSPITYQTAGNWDFSFGPGFMFYILQGSGGTKELDNGTGKSTFPLPSKTVTSRLFFLQLGSGYDFAPYRFDLDLIINGPLSTGRSYNLMFSFLYRFGSSGS